MKIIVYILNALIFFIPTYLFLTRKEGEGGFSNFWLLLYVLFYLSLIFFRLPTSKVVFSDPIKGYMIVFFLLLPILACLSYFFWFEYSLTDPYKPYLYSLILTSAVLFLFFYKYPWPADYAYNKGMLYVMYGVFLYIFNYNGIVGLNKGGHYGIPQKYRVDEISRHETAGSSGLGFRVSPSAASYFVKVKNWHNPKKKVNISISKEEYLQQGTTIYVTEKVGLLGIKSYRYQFVE